MEFDGKADFADGIRADEDGNIWASAGWVGDGYDGVHVFAPNGDRIGHIRLPSNPVRQSSPVDVHEQVLTPEHFRV